MVSRVRDVRPQRRQPTTECRQPPNWRATIPSPPAAAAAAAELVLLIVNVGGGVGRSSCSS
jgi:hypothetical protein